MFHGKILVGWKMLKENFRRFVFLPILNSIPPPPSPSFPHAAPGGGGGETCFIRFLFVYQVL